MGRSPSISWRSGWGATTRTCTPRSRTSSRSASSNGPATAAYPCRGTSYGPSSSSEPAGFLEARPQPAVEAGHQSDGKRVAERPVELRHVPEVHAVDAGDHGRHGDQRTVGGEPLGHL